MPTRFVEVTPFLAEPHTLFTCVQIKKLDELIIKHENIASFQLMHRVGEVAFQLVISQWPQCQHYKVFAGAGNNGGDAYVVAALLQQAGRNVEVFATKPVCDLQEPAQTAAKEAIKQGVMIYDFLISSSVDFSQPQTLIIDGLLGIGFLNRGEYILSPVFMSAIEMINRSGCSVFSLDVPSGLNADTGDVSTIAVKAEVTLTFIGVKRGLLTGVAPDYIGKLYLASLQVDEALFKTVQCAAKRVTFAQIADYLPARSIVSHKGHHGHVWIIGGAFGMCGAVILAAEAALRAGAGKVTVVTHQAHISALNARLPEAMSFAWDALQDMPGQELLYAALLAQADVLLIGPGLGQGIGGKNLLSLAIKWSNEKKRPLVMDADALNLIASAPNEFSYDSSKNWVMTPHPGEAARLLNVTVGDIQVDRFLSVVKLHQKWHATVLLKGAGTLIYGGDHVIYLSHTGNAGMASGGMGDVLSGIISALIGQGLPLTPAVKAAVFIHGLAADEVKKKQGERGMIASDLCQFLPIIINRTHT